MQNYTSFGRGNFKHNEMTLSYFYPLKTKITVRYT